MLFVCATITTCVVLYSVRAASFECPQNFTTSQGANGRPDILHFFWDNYNLDANAYDYVAIICTSCNPQIKKKAWAAYGSLPKNYTWMGVTPGKIFTFEIYAASSNIRSNTTIIQAQTYPNYPSYFNARVISDVLYLYWTAPTAVDIDMVYLQVCGTEERPASGPDARKIEECNETIVLDNSPHSVAKSMVGEGDSAEILEVEKRIPLDFNKTPPGSHLAIIFEANNLKGKPSSYVHLTYYCERPADKINGRIVNRESAEEVDLFQSGLAYDLECNNGYIKIRGEENSIRWRCNRGEWTNRPACSGVAIYITVVCELICTVGGFAAIYIFKKRKKYKTSITKEMTTSATADYPTATQLYARVTQPEIFYKSAPSQRHNSARQPPSQRGDGTVDPQQANSMLRMATTPTHSDQSSSEEDFTVNDSSFLRRLSAVIQRKDVVIEKATFNNPCPQRVIIDSPAESGKLAPGRLSIQDYTNKSGRKSIVIHTDNWVVKIPDISSTTHDKSESETEAENETAYTATATGYTDYSLRMV